MPRPGRGPWLVALGLLPVYLLTLHHAHGWDSIAYAARSVHDPLLSERYLSARLFHPHHLLYVPLAILAQAVAALFTGHVAASGEAAFTAPMALNALCGAASAGLAGALAARLGASPARATAAALAVGVSNALWRYATEVEVMAPALVFLLLGAWLVAGRRGRGRAALAGLAFAAAVLLHQIAVLCAGAATLVVAANALAARRRGEPAAAGQAAVFAAAWTLPVAACYLVVGARSATARTPAALLDWMLAARGRSTFASHGLLHALRETLRAAAESLVSLRPLADARHEPILALVAAAIVLWALATGLSALPRLAHALAEPSAVGARTVALGLALTVLFIAWFQPWNDDYWVYVPALAVALAAAHVPRGRLVAPGVFVIALALLGAVNLVAAQLPAMDARSASYAGLLDDTRAAGLRRGDVLLSGGVDTPIGEGIVALPFFAGVRVIPAPDPRDAADVAHFGQEAAAAMAAARAAGHASYATPAGRAGLGRTAPLDPRDVLPVRLGGETLCRVSAGGGAG